MNYLKKTDKEIAKLIKLEEKRQQDSLMMIPSENIASKAVEMAVGSVFGNKYAEGYPFKRYYQGQEFADKLESLVVQRAKELFHVPYVNVQPLSGSPANFAVYNALLKPNDIIMGLSLDAGGHLTHGARFTASSKYFKSVQYGVNEKGIIDYKEVRKLALEHKPHIIVAGTTAYSRHLDWKKFSDIAEEVGAYLLADISHISGLVAAGVYPHPGDFVHIITTTTHKTLRGPRGGMIMVTRKGLEKNSELPKKIDSSIIPGIQGGPHLNTIAGIGVALKEASTESYKKYAIQIVKNAQVLAEACKEHGLKVVTGGTDSHMFMVDLRNYDVLGNTVAEALENAGIILNRNSVPHDTNPPFYPQGIRMGTPGITSRGLKEEHMRAIAKAIAQIIKETSDVKKKLKFNLVDERDQEVRSKIIKKITSIKTVSELIKSLCSEFPIKPSYL